MAHIRILIADDHPAVRRALGDVFAETADIRVVAECTDGSEVVEAALRTEPDVVLMDEAMPQMSGLQATRALLAARPYTRVLMLTGTVTVAAICEALELGAAGYLVKGDNVQGLPQCVRTVAAGFAVWSSSAAAHLSDCN